MRIVTALGGNALLQRRDRPDAVLQRHHVHDAVAALRPLAEEHELLVTHGNGPQVGVLALESAADGSLSSPYPFDVLGAETQGMIGYWLVQEIGNAVPARPVAGLLTQTVVAGDDPAFGAPTKFVGPSYEEGEARRLAASGDWVVRRDGERWRRVVPSPAPVAVVEADLIRSLLGDGVLVVCAGGGGVPVVRDPDGSLRGVEAVVDKDATASLLARELDADLLLVLTDVPAVSVDWGTPAARAIRSAVPAELRARSFPAGSMGPKVAAVCDFVERTGRPAAIGALADVSAIVAGEAGTTVRAAAVGAA